MLWEKIEKLSPTTIFLETLPKSGGVDWLEKIVFSLSDKKLRNVPHKSKDYGALKACFFPKKQEAPKADGKT